MEGYSNTTIWKETEIRHQLNTKYFQDCFSESEKTAILTTKVKTKLPDSSLSVTMDKLYIPALEDIENIPEHLKIGRCIYTDKSDDIPFVDLYYSIYWLRDPGDYEDENLIVQGYEDSKIVLDSLDHNSDEVGVRVVIWVDAEKIGKDIE